MSDLINNEISIFWFAIGAIGIALLGSWHCAGMCGPIAMLANRSRDIVIYHIGRLLAYVSLGWAAGTLGEHLLCWIPRDRQWIAGLLLGALAFWTLLSVWRFRWFGRIQRFFWSKRPRGPNSEFLAIGILNGLLPCSWLYGFLIMGAGLQSPVRSSILLFSLWLGSLPWLVGVSFLGAKVKTTKIFGTWLQPILMIAVIVSLLLHQFHLHHHHH